MLKLRKTMIATALLAGAASIFLSVGCKKKPPAETPVAVAPAQPVEPPKPIVEPAPPPPPPPPAPVAPRPPEPKRLTAAELNQRAVLKPVYFDFDKHDLRDDARATLAANAEWLKGNASWRILVEGHCDERGTNEYNLALGDRRANAAKNYLISAGVNAGRIRTISYGEERPGDPGHDEMAWTKNRRADFMIEE